MIMSEALVASRMCRMVGTSARIRVSSITCPLSIGTSNPARSRTRFPRRSADRSVWYAKCGQSSRIERTLVNCSYKKARLSLLTSGGQETESILRVLRGVNVVTLQDTASVSDQIHTALLDCLSAHFIKEFHDLGL